MILTTFHRYELGDTCVEYLQDETGHITWQMYPSRLAELVKLPPDDPNTFSLIQAKLRADPYDKNFSNGETMFNSATSRNLTFVSQIAEWCEWRVTITTRLRDGRGNDYRHYLEWIKGEKRFKSWTSVWNQTTVPESLDWLASFFLGGISPFHERQPAKNLHLLRQRSKWAMEGRLEEAPVENYALEPSWKASGLALERFGQNGTMPVRRFFPLVGLKDQQYDVIWLAELAGQASWQLNVARLGDRVMMFGGLPDHDNGNWQVELKPNEEFVSPFVYLTVGEGNYLAVSQRLQPSKQRVTLPRIYNEWATTWGRPNLRLVQDSLPLLQQHGFDYYVVDAGWYQSTADTNWETSHGDWIVDSERFPGGFKALVAAIHHAAMKAGIWYEFETVGKDSQAFQKTDKLISRDSQVVTTLKRRFWNLLDPEVARYLQTRFADVIQQAGFDYLKVDYNDNVGVAMDYQGSTGAEALELLTQQTLAWFDVLHRANPELVIENCSSGGHRLTPAYIEKSDYSSFSDAHETTSIPIIAANELSVIPARQNLIWCVAHPEDTVDKLFFHLISTMHGVLDFSGDIRQLSDQQWTAIDQSFEFRDAVDPIISAGTPFRFGPSVASYSCPQGFQVSGFVSGEGFEDSDAALVMAFGFSPTEQVQFDNWPLGQGWQIEKSVGSKEIQLELGGSDKPFVRIPAGKTIAHAWSLRKLV